MIPQFPEWKSLELNDKEEVEKITSKYPPYSDFNFVSMWSWDIKDDMRISQLNGNLVVRFTDYLNGQPFFSFLGDNMVNETAEALLEFSKKEGMGAELKLVPECATKGIDTSKFEVKEDMDHFDYIILLSILKEYNTSHTRSRKKAVKSLLNKFKPEVKLFDLSEIDNQKAVLRLVTERPKFDKNVIENELLAISRFITGHKEVSVLPIGVFVDSEMVGFIFSEVLNEKFAVSHFWKADIKVSQHLYS